jgi:hypothetical protein
MASLHKPIKYIILSYRSLCTQIGPIYVKRRTYGKGNPQDKKNNFINSNIYDLKTKYSIENYFL